jgi:hypothetical protein
VVGIWATILAHSANLSAWLRGSQNNKKMLPMRNGMLPQSLPNRLDKTLLASKSLVPRNSSFTKKN